MARLNICGFETGDASEVVGLFGTSSIQTTTKRTAAYALRVNPTAGTGCAIINTLDATGAAASIGRTAATYFRAYVRIATLPGATTALLQVVDSGGNSIVNLNCTSGGVLTLVGSTTSSAIATLSTGTWYRVEITAVKNATSEARVDGGTAQTCTGGNFTIDQFRCGNTGATATTMDIFYDDVAIDDAAYPGVGQVNILKPNATGTTSAWTNGAGTSPTNVAEVPHDSDTSYITSSTSGNVTTVNLDSCATGGVSGTVAAAKTIGIVRDTVGVSSVSLRAKSGASNSDTTALDPGSTYVALAKVLTTDPATSAAWTTTALDALEIGVVNGANVGLRCTALYAMVESSGSVTTTVTPSTLSLTTSLKTPTIFQQLRAKPSSLANTISLKTPSAVLATAIRPTTGSLVTARFTPTVPLIWKPKPSTLALTLNGQTPVLFNLVPHKTSAILEAQYADSQTLNANYAATATLEGNYADSQTLEVA